MDRGLFIGLFPTILEVTGTPVPNTEPCDGVSLLDSMRGKASSPHVLFWHYPHYHLAGIHGPASAVRSGDWKYLRYYETELTGEGAQAELFDLKNDPGETTNLADSHRERAQQLRAELASWLISVGAQFPLKNPDFDPVREQQSNRSANPSE